MPIPQDLIHVWGAGASHSLLDCHRVALYLDGMIKFLALLVFNLDDRARLRERFFGATRTVLARR